jgi:hypothetical protein
MMVLSPHLQPEDAMGFAERFVAAFDSGIVSVLNCFDRVIFKGYLPFGGEGHLNAWVDRGLGMRRKDFLPLLDRHSNTLVDHAKALADGAGRPYVYRQGRFSKERFIQDMARADGLTEGLVAVLCVQETCRTVALKYGPGRPRLCFKPRPQRVLYYYHLDRAFGLMHVRVQTWFPYTIQVYVNGHDWLARQMHRKRLGFVQQDNAFTQLDDPHKAQQLADGFAQLNWVKQLTKWAHQVNPHIKKGGWLSGMDYYWVTAQAEYATDILFTGRDKLRDLFPRLADHAAVNLSAKDILAFLGRKLHGNFRGEVLSDCKKKRQPGTRVKHRVKENWLKMYDKFGLILRVETVINQPREFRVRRKRLRDGRRQMVWCPMNKGVSNLPSYQRVSRAANGRYLDALSCVADPTPAYRRVTHLTESKRHRGRRYAGFNPARRQDVKLFQAVLEGDHHLRGFRNADIRRALWGDTRDPHQRKRQAHAVTRLLKRLHVRGLVAKIPRTRRWRITTQGQQLLGGVVQLHYHGLANAA